MGDNRLNLMLTSIMMVVLAGSVDCDQVIGGTIRGAVNQANTEAIRVSRILDAKDIEERINDIEEEMDSLEQNELDLEDDDELLKEEEKMKKKKKKNKNKNKNKKNRIKN